MQYANFSEFSDQNFAESHPFWMEVANELIWVIVYLFLFAF